MYKHQYSDELRLVSVSRGKKMPSVTGHLWVMTESFALISEVDDGLALDGFVILPTWQKLRLKFNFKGKEFFSKVLGGAVPKKLIDVLRDMDISNLNSILNELYCEGMFVMVHPELKYLDTAWLGPIKKISKKQLALTLVSPIGEDMGSMRISLRDITKIEFATRYALAFELFCKEKRGSMK